MTEATFGERALYAVTFFLIGMTVVVVRLIPFETVPGRLPGPDLLLCVVFAWTIRRPDLLPLWLMAPLLFLADILLMRPPGLHAALVIALSEILRSRHARLQTISVGWEILLAGLASVAIIGTEWLVLAALLVPQPDALRQLAQAPVNMAAYPFIILACYMVLGLRKHPAGPVRDARGAR